MEETKELDVVENEQQEEVGLWDLFEDRLESLLRRWSKFHSKHPELEDKTIIKICLLEMNDAYTKSLMD